MSDTPRTAIALGATLDAGFDLGPQHRPLVELCRELERELAALRTGDTCARQCEGTAYRIEARQLAAELAARRADAERYRWLRGGPDVPPESNRWARWEVRHWCGRWWNTMFAEALDAAIDAARAGGGK